MSYLRMKISKFISELIKRDLETTQVNLWNLPDGRAVFIGGDAKIVLERATSHCIGPKKLLRLGRSLTARTDQQIATLEKFAERISNKTKELLKTPYIEF